MSFVYSQHFNAKKTPQTEAIPGKSMIANSAGGYSFAADQWARLDRFLILGSEGGSYYATERKLSRENAEVVVQCAREDAVRTIARIVAISQSGRAPRNDPAEFALAIVGAVADAAGKAGVAVALPRVCRTGGQLFHFMEAASKLRGWGYSLRNALASWYTRRTADDLAYQVVKYQSRGDWSHRDVLRLCHPKPPNDAHQAVYRWITRGADGLGEIVVTKPTRQGPGEAPVNLDIVYPDVRSHLPRKIAAFEELKTAPLRRVVELIEDERLTREFVPTQHLNSPEVWEALLPHMPLEALIRNLGKMSAVGLLAPLSDASRRICDVLRDPDRLVAARLHPIKILTALKTYSNGAGDKGSLYWTPVSQVVAALDGAFYLAFGAIEPSNARTLLALDVSGSMTYSTVAGTNLTPREASVVMAMVTARTEPAHELTAFSHRLVPLDVTAADSLDAATRKVERLPYGATDCALPMLEAERRRTNVDVFGVYTDSETYAGAVHPTQALASYRARMGIPARMFVCAMVSNGFSIADPADSGQLDVVGFDAATPQLVADFAAGRL